MDKDQQDTGGDTRDMREGGATAGSEATSSSGNTRKNSKRKQLITGSEGTISKKSKSAGLTSYLLSKKSSSSVESESSQDQSSTAAWDTHSSTTETVDEGASTATSSTVEYDCADYNFPSDSEWLFQDCDLAAFSNFDDDTAN